MRLRSFSPLIIISMLYCAWGTLDKGSIYSAVPKGASDPGNFHRKGTDLRKSSFATLFFFFAAIAAFALFAAAGPALADTPNYFGLQHSLKISTPAAPGETRIPSGHNGFFRSPDSPNRAHLLFADPVETRFPFRSPEAIADAGRVTLETTPGLSWMPSEKKSYFIPALEIVGLLAAINGAARLLYPNDTTEDGQKIYSTNFSTFWDNLTRGHWIIDHDDFTTNQFQHPYMGGTMHGFARSAGLGYWESMGYTLVGGFLWSAAGETGRISINDQIATGLAGNFLGEPLFRMASLLLENTGPGFWRELGAALISPPTGINRFAFGERFKSVFPGHKPAYFWRLELGSNFDAHHSGPDTDPGQGEVFTGFSMEYGLPGKPGYRYTRPFDYFKLEASVGTNSSSVLRVLSARGLLWGKEYSAGDAYRGVWGLYGSHDFFWGDPARVSSTAASIGTTAQWWMAPQVALQGTLLGGFGYGAGGEIRGFPGRVYRYGAIAQGMVDLRLLLSDLAMIDFRGNHYHIGDVLATAPEGSETVTRLGLGITLRLQGRHALGLRYQFSARDTRFRYPGIENVNQEVGMISLVYTFLSEEGFGAVDFGSFPK